ncbi:hypothetical protein HG531_005031 [Fusarium graminearum]|nr:hypothetical protein HG531_005031 [Fusarium graminearum]
MRASGCTPFVTQKYSRLCFFLSLVLGSLRHGVEGGAVLEPLDLGFVEGVREGHLEGLAAIGRVDNEGEGLANLELGAEDIDLVIRSDLVVVGRVREGQGQHTLLLEVGLVDTSEGAGDNGKTTKVTGLKSGMLSRRAFAVVPVANDNPLDALGLVVASDSGNSAPLTSGVVLDLVGLIVSLVDGTNQHVVGDVVKVTTVLQPGTGHGDMDLKTVRGGGNVNIDTGAVLGGGLGVGERVEVKGASNRHGDDQIGRGDERVGGRVTVVSAGEVTVVRRDDGVGLALLDVTSIPLTNAGTTSVGKNDTAELLEGLELAITLNGGADLLGTRSDSESRLGLDTVVESITGNGSSTGHVLVGGVGARTDQADLELLGPAVLLDSLAELGDGSSQIGSERTVDVGLELREVDLDKLVVLDVLVRAEAVGVRAGEVTDLLSLGGGEVIVHAIVEGEDREVTYHVANSSHTSARDGIGSGAVVFDDGTSATLDSEDISNLEDNILRSSPAVELAGQLNTNDVRGLQFPVEVGHNIDGISTTDTDSGHTKTTTIDSVRVSTNKKTTGEAVVLEKNLVDDTGTGLPETDIVLGTGSGKEVVNLLVDVNSASKILGTTDLSLNQVVTVDSGGVGNLVHASRHELEDGHLSGSILASNTIRSQLEVALTTLNILTMGISQVRVQDLLGISQGSVQTRADDIKVFGHLLVVDVVTLLPVVLADLYKQSQLGFTTAEPRTSGFAFGRRYIFFAHAKARGLGARSPRNMVKSCKPWFLRKDEVLELPPPQAPARTSPDCISARNHAADRPGHTCCPIADKTITYTWV